MLLLSSSALLLAQFQADGTLAPTKVKFLEAAVSLAQTLTQWALLIVGGTLAVIVGTSYYQPDSIKTRRIYLLFIPAWVLLAFSISNGSAIQRRYLAYLFLSPNNANYQGTVTEILTKINIEAYRQFVTLEWALVCLAVWLFLYLGWWMNFKGKHDDI